MNFTRRRGHLYAEEMPLTELAGRFGTPLFVYSQNVLLTRANTTRRAARARDPLARVCFAVKANGNVHLLRLLREAGLGADVTGGGELFLARRAGFAARHILFSGVGKTATELEEAIAAGVGAVHVESEGEFEQIQKVASNRQRSVRVGVRVNPDVSVETHRHISTGRSTHKFGVPPETALTLLRRADAARWLRPVGLAAHIGSQIATLAPFVAAARTLVALADRLAGEGIKLEYLDGGGGFAIDYANIEAGQQPDPSAWVNAVADIICGAGYGLVLEPGRSVVGPAGLLLTRVTYTKQQGRQHFAIVDAAMNDLLRPALYDAHHPIVPVQTKEGPHQATTVVGPVCETADTLGHDVSLPPLQAGDLLAIGHAGAYGFAMSSNYNGRPRAAEVLVHGDQARLIRRRQTYAALLDGTDL